MRILLPVFIIYWSNASYVNQAALKNGWSYSDAWIGGGRCHCSRGSSLFLYLHNDGDVEDSEPPSTSDYLALAQPDTMVTDTPQGTPGKDTVLVPVAVRSTLISKIDALSPTVNKQREKLCTGKTPRRRD